MKFIFRRHRRISVTCTVKNHRTGGNAAIYAVVPTCNALRRMRHTDGYPHIIIMRNTSADAAALTFKSKVVSEYMPHASVQCGNGGSTRSGVRRRFGCRCQSVSPTAAVFR
ncbi:MAG: hypothetical protein ACI3XQ_12070 [Eubacteriales bacterium]